MKSRVHWDTLQKLFHSAKDVELIRRAMGLAAELLELDCQHDDLSACYLGLKKAAEETTEKQVVSVVTKLIDEIQEEQMLYDRQNPKPQQTRHPARRGTKKDRTANTVTLQEMVNRAGGGNDFTAKKARRILRSHGYYSTSGSWNTNEKDPLLEEVVQLLQQYT